MHIEKVNEVSDELFEAITRLVPYLGDDTPLPAQEAMVSLVNSESSTLWIARYPDEGGDIVGMLSIAIYLVPTGIRSIVEDVVVDPAMRRQGIAKTLLNSAIAYARGMGASGVALTSNPKRVEANQLYVSVGFERRETNSYFYQLK